MALNMPPKPNPPPPLGFVDEPFVEEPFDPFTPWSMIEDAVTEFPFTVPCTIRLSPTAMLPIAVLVPFFTIVVLAASIVYVTLLAFVTVIDVPLTAVTLPPMTGSPFP